MAAILSAIMFVSGAAALSFETLWFRQAGLAFGNGVWASSLVLTSFMAGLALGNGLAARFAERITRPLRVYALLEIGIGVAGVALVVALPLLAGWLVPLWRPILDAPWLLNPLRLAIAFALLVIPATAMGATLPVLVTALRARDPNFGSVLGRLYGWNTLGAVVGALAGEVWWVEWFGVRGAGFAAAGLNAVAAAGAWALGRNAAADVSPAPAAIAPDRAPAPARAGRAIPCLLAAAALAGGTLLALEVIWFRLLHLFVYDTGLSFALVLAVVLAGIGLGGGAAGAWLRRAPEAHRHAAAVALASGAFAALCYRLFADAVAPYASQVIREPLDIAWLSFVLMFPTSFASGVIFTLTGTALERAVGQATRATGWLTLANTLGGGLGALLAGFWLLTAFGVEASLAGLAALYAVTAALLFGAGSLPRPRTAIVAAAGVAFAVAILAFPIGQMQRRFLATVAERMGDPGAKVIGYREGLTETVVILRKDLGDTPLHYRLVTGGFGMASTTTWARRYMKQFVYWPVALRPDPRSALLISYGIGNTAQALAETTSLERIDVVDISRDVLAMSDLVYDDGIRGRHPLRDPRVRVHVDDGRFFLLTTPERYDLITSEPPPPKHAGIVNLYTREYFQLVHDRLAEGGINTYWLPVHSLMLEDTLAILRAYCDVFADCSLWSGAGLNWMLAGSRGADWPRDEFSFRAQWRSPIVSRELRRLGFGRPEGMGATFLADAAHLALVTQNTPPLVDDHPKRLSDETDFRASRVDHVGWLDSERAAERFASSDFVARAWPPELRERTLDFFPVQEAIDRARGVRLEKPIGPAERVRGVHAALRDAALGDLALWWLEIDSDRIEAVERLLAAGASEERFAFQLGAQSLAAHRYQRAAAHFDVAARRVRKPRVLPYLRVYARQCAGDAAGAKALGAELFGEPPRTPADAEFLRWIESLPSDPFRLPRLRFANERGCR